MKNILYKHRTRGVGGESVHIQGMVGGFRQLGYSIDFASPPLVRNLKNQNPSGNRFYRIITYFFPPLIYELLALAYNFVSYMKCRNSLRKRSYCFIYERYALFDFSSVFLKKKHKIPLILEVNGLFNSKDKTHDRKTVLLSLGSYLEKQLIGASDLIIVVSTFLKETLIRMGVPPGKILLLPNAVDMEHFQNKSGENIRDKYGLNNKRIIGFVGSFDTWHGLDLLVECIEDIHILRKDAHLLLVGDGKERKRVEKLIGNKKLESVVTITGLIPHSEIPSYIAAMDIGTMPDSNNFGSPLKIFEYMAKAKPVVSARYGPTSEIIKDGFNGLLFEPNNCKEFVKLITKLLEDHELRETLGTAARKDVFENHTWVGNARRALIALGHIL